MSYEKVLQYEAQQRILFDGNDQYELRGKFEPCRDGVNRIYWRAYFRGFELHEIVKSRDPALVYADLEEWISVK